MKRRTFLTTSLATSAWASCNLVHAEEGDFNPTALESLRAGVPDPAAIEARDGSGYYVYATGHGVVIWHSKDLRNWKRIGRVFERHVRSPDVTGSGLLTSSTWMVATTSTTASPRSAANAR